MKSLLKPLINQAIEAVIADINPELSSEIRTKALESMQITPPKNTDHGDLACNIAMILAKPLKMSPRKIAEAIVEKLPTHPEITKIDLAGPGFINVFFKASAKSQIVQTILQQGTKFGQIDQSKVNKRIQVEYVSANPTGPLHVGHGRGAAFGATLANLMAFAGYQVEREYYVNDAGRQMHILATSIWLRALATQHPNATLPFAANGYKGDYVWDIAKLALSQFDDISKTNPLDKIQKLFQQAMGPDAEIDALIECAKQTLGETYQDLFQLGVNQVLDDIRQDLTEFGVEFDRWYSEASLVDQNLITAAVDKLKAAGFTYEKEGALWFRSTDFGDDKDRVVIRDNGQATYFASDLGYHWDKYQRGYDEIINIWGADHHGYITRVKAGIQAMGLNPESLKVLLVQFAILYRGKERLAMSTRSGSFVTLRTLREEVGNDAARYFYCSRKCEQHMDFDLELATSTTKDNPIYYLQYAHARICSVMKSAPNHSALGLDLNLLTEAHELELISLLSRFPELIEQAAMQREPHQVATYLREVAGLFHSYYNAHKVLVENQFLQQARLCLLQATQQVIANGLGILGIEPATSM